MAVTFVFTVSSLMPVCGFKCVISVKGSGCSNVSGGSLKVCVWWTFSAFPEEISGTVQSDSQPERWCCQHHRDTPAPFVEVQLHVSCHFLAPLLPTPSRHQLPPDPSCQTQPASNAFQTVAAALILLHLLQATLQGGVKNFNLSTFLTHEEACLAFF